MGTTLFAIVEQCGNDGALWSEVATWAFDKNYDLSGVLFMHAQKGWPPDSWAHVSSYHRIHDQGRLWCPGENLLEFIEAAVKDLDRNDWRRVMPEALGASVRVLMATRHVRVLWYNL